MFNRYIYGAEIVGDGFEFNANNIINALAEGTKGAVNLYNQSQTEKAAKADAERLAKAVIAADDALVNARADAALAASVAAATKNAADVAKANAAAQVARSAEANVSRAEMNLPDAAREKRVEEAGKRADKAAKEAYDIASQSANSPSDKGKEVAARHAQMRSSAAQEVAARAAGNRLAPSSPQGAPAPIGPAAYGGSGENIFTKKYGPLPGYGWIGLMAGAGIVAKMYLGRR